MFLEQRIRHPSVGLRKCLRLLQLGLGMRASARPAGDITER